MVRSCAYSETPVTFENCIPGKLVKRGNDWRWGNQDHQNGLPGTGVIVECRSDKNAVVKWSNGNIHLYRVGYEAAFDLFYSGNNK